MNFLFNDCNPWLKTLGNRYFDAPMGYYNGADVCELVGSFISTKLRRILGGENVGLYGSDELSNRWQVQN